jgi:Cytochrome P460
MEHKSKLTIAIASAVLAVLDPAVIYAQDHAQDKYLLKTSSGIAFSDFRGYEDWAVASSARTDEVLKVIVANPAMINAYKAGVPGNGQPFPDGSMIVKLQWRPSSWICQTSLSRLSSWKRTAKDFRKAADGDTRCSTTKPHRTISRPIPARRIAETRAIRL